ncbi:hypothetical protein ACSFCX_07720 [Yokenella regensburgei]|uniref:hypothetical protein n=1 Tax=Yokenella regensburgei TaxID=158877 RepID=UPI003ED8FB42
MIIVVCTDDPKLFTIAKNSLSQDPIVFFSVYQVFRGRIPVLGVAEDLFMIAHGVFEGDEGQPVIGDEKQAFYLNGDQCFLNIAPIIPAGYRGRVFVDACESADETSHMDSFISRLQVQFLVNGMEVKVFGVNGKNSGLIPTPGDSKWVPAQLMK